MGVLNATPDSFYAGSRAPESEAALSFTDEMIHAGADVLDIGGESTRPGADAVSLSDELNRVLPVIDAIRARWPDTLLSIDTQKAEVAQKALARGANIVNDISALRFDPAMAEVVAEFECPVVLMHMRGTPRTMQSRPEYENVIDELKDFFEERLGFAARHKISENRIVLDPGIGFGKTLDHNMAILKQLGDFLPLGRPLLVGVSRKSFIGKLLVQPAPEERLEGSLAAALWAVHEGASGLRVHDVASTRRAVTMWEGIRSA
jgi:dihydropteroate synthase